MARKATPRVGTWRDALLLFRDPKNGGVSALADRYQRKLMSRWVLKKLLSHLQATSTDEPELLAWVQETVSIPKGRVSPKIGDRVLYTVGSGRQVKDGTAPRLRLPLHFFDVDVGQKVAVIFEKPGRIIVEAVR